MFFDMKSTNISPALRGILINKIVGKVQAECEIRSWKVGVSQPATTEVLW